MHVLDCSPQDVIRVSFVFRAGTSTQPVPFSASTTANMLSEGSARHTALQLAEALDFYGSWFDVSLDRDYVVITFASLSKFFAQTIATAREILLEPAFAENELATYCAKRKQRLKVERSKADYRAREIFAGSLFGCGHPYGVSYDEDEYDNLTRDTVLDFYRRYYTAENCFVVCSGKVGAAEAQAVAALASDIPSCIIAGGVPGDRPFPTPQQEHLKFSPYPNAVQSSLRIGRLFHPRSHPDFIPMQVLTTILGGYFGSRLVHNLREEHGYTYGVFSAMVNLRRAGYMAITTEVGSDVTQDAVNQIFMEMEKLTDRLVPAGELDLARNIMIGEVMRILDGPFGIADVTIESVQNGTDNRYLDSFLRIVREITPEQVREVARKYLVPSEFTTVVVGNPSLASVFE